MAIKYNPPPSGPEPLGDILSRLFTARGWGRKQERVRLENAWNMAVEDRHRPHARVLAIKRGVLEIEVKSSVMMQELAQFQKRRLLEALRKNLQGTTITDLRFKAGSW